MRSLRGRAAVLVFAVALATAAGVVGAPTANAASWDPRIEPIAHAVEKLRGLEFEHPVPVDFLTEAAFKKGVAIHPDKLSPADQESLALAQLQLRAIGLLGDDVNLADALSSLQTSGALAKYDPGTKRATVRGKKLDGATKVTLAHELTHALQDQHFNLIKLQHVAERNHSSSALKALVEGDAVRVQQLYAADLPVAERTEYQQSQVNGSNGVLADLRAQGVPDSLSVLSQSPYTLGPLMLDVVQAVNGEKAIDGEFRDPPAADSAFLTPSTLVDGAKPTKVATPTPTLADGERVQGTRDVFGPFALYLMLASRADPVAALVVADGWAGDAMVTFERGDTACIRTTFAGPTKEATGALGDALQQWAAAGPAGAAGVESANGQPTLTACDPGTASAASAAAGDGSLAALTVAAFRNQLLATVIKEGASVKVGNCTANGVIADPAFRPILAASVADPSAARRRRGEAPAAERVEDRDQLRQVARQGPKGRVRVTGWEAVRGAGRRSGRRGRRRPRRQCEAC